MSREKINQLCDDLIKQVSNKLTHIGTGRHRAVFASKSGKYVIKLPVNDWGICAQDTEYRICKKHTEQSPHVRLIHDSQGIPIIIMEYVNTKITNPLPAWCDFVDCHQVGYTRSGKLVAYDQGG